MSESELLPKFRDGQVSANMVLRTRGREHHITKTLLSAMDYSNSLEKVERLEARMLKLSRLSKENGWNMPENEDDFMNEIKKSLTVPRL